MRFHLVFGASLTALVAHVSSIVSFETVPVPTDFSDTAALQASNFLPSKTDDSFQNEDNASNVNDYAISLLYPPVDVSLASDSGTPENPGADEIQSPLNTDSSTLIMNPLIGKNSLEVGCPPKDSTKPGKLRNRGTGACSSPNRMEINLEPPDKETVERINKLLDEDRVWKRKNGMAVYQQNYSNCGKNGGYRRIPACCLGPKVDDPGDEKSFFQAFTSFENCVPLLEGRPWCADPENRKCCEELILKDTTIPGTWYGENCVLME